MPELPEVEIARRNLTRWLKGREVVAAEADETRIFRGAETQDFAKLKGRVASIDRRGKYLMLHFANGRGLMSHLGMTGKFLRRAKGEAVRFSRARFTLDDGTVLHYADPRLFGRMEPVPADQLRALKAVKDLGLDPLADGLTPERLKAALGKTTLDLKIALMDQGKIAGLGNIHAAEALFRAGLHPARKPATLTADEWKALSASIGVAITFALENQEGDEIEYVEEPGAANVFLVYGHGEEPCTECDTPIESFAQGGRTTYFCPRCQPSKGKRS